jgi:hypothetical protein
MLEMMAYKDALPYSKIGILNVSLGAARILIKGLA